MPPRRSSSGLLLIQALSVLFVTTSSTDLDGRRISVIYVGLPCRHHSGKYLPELWDNHNSMVLGPLRQIYNTVDLYGFFNSMVKVDGISYGISVPSFEPNIRCMEKIASLTDWRELLFSDSEQGLDVRSSGAMGDSRRSLALKRFAVDNATLVSRYDRIFVLRPDLWFRQALPEWGLSELDDLQVSHWECDSRFTCLENPRTSGMTSDAFFVMSARFVEGLVRSRPEAQPKLLARLYLPLDRRGPHKNLLSMRWRVLSLPKCCIQTRTIFWHPLYSVGKKCCYVVNTSDALTRPTCFGSEWFSGDNVHQAGDSYGEPGIRGSSKLQLDEQYLLNYSVDLPFSSAPTQPPECPARLRGH